MSRRVQKVCFFHHEVLSDDSDTSEMKTSGEIINQDTDTQLEPDTMASNEVSDNIPRYDSSWADSFIATIQKVVRS